MRRIPLLAASVLLVACQSGGEDAGQGAPGQPATSPAGTTTPTTTPSPSASPTASGPAFPRTIGSAPTPVEVREHQIENGAPPRVEYVAGLDDSQVVVAPDGSVVATLEVTPMGNEGYRHVSFAPYADGWLTGYDAMGPSATLMEPDGSLGDSLGSGPFDDVFSRASRREVVFSFIPWNSIHFRPQIAVLGPSGVHRLGPARSTAGFLGDHEVVVNSRDGVFRIDTRDLSRAPVPGITSSAMVSSRAGWLIGDAKGTHGVFDATSGEPILGSPDHQLVGFSPSGKFVVGYQQPSSDRLLLIVAEVRTGRVLQAFEMRSSDPPASVLWEDERTFLGGSGLRLRLDGTVERVPILGPTRGGLLTLFPPPVS